MQIVIKTERIRCLHFLVTRLLNVLEVKPSWLSPISSKTQLICLAPQEQTLAAASENVDSFNIWSFSPHFADISQEVLFIQLNESRRTKCLS